MRIAISSKSGCGNTTVTTLLAEKLGYKMVNFTFRQLAAERGVDFWTFCRMAEADDDIDRELDRRQVEMAMAEENCVLGSRLAIWMLEKAASGMQIQETAMTTPSPSHPTSSAMGLEKMEMMPQISSDNERLDQNATAVDLLLSSSSSNWC